MFTNRTKALSATAALFAGALMLTACSGGQSKADACSIIDSANTTLNNDVTSATSEITTDPESAVTTISDAVDAFKESTSKVTNDEIRAKLDTVNDTLDDVVSVYEDYAADPENMDVEDMTTASTELQDAGVDLVDTCNS